MRLWNDFGFPTLSGLAKRDWKQKTRRSPRGTCAASYLIDSVLVVSFWLDLKSTLPALGQLAAQVEQAGLVDFGL